jgi:hypothetical protein
VLKRVIDQKNEILILVMANDLGFVFKSGRETPVNNGITSEKEGERRPAIF